MSEIASLLIISIPVVLIFLIMTAIFEIVLGTFFALFQRLWLKTREKNMSKLAKEYGLNFSSDTPNLKQCVYQEVWPFALRVDHKTNYIEGEIKGHKIFICDNFFSGPRVFWKPLNEHNSRTVIKIDDQEIK